MDLDGQRIVEILDPEPTAPGMAYHGFQGQRGQYDPFDAFNHHANNIKVSGIAQDINMATNSNGHITLPGQAAPILAKYYGILFQGYFRAPMESSYTLTSSVRTDDFAYIWTHEKALSNWSSYNYDTFSSYGRHSGSTSFSLAAGEEIPVTILWINDSGPGRLDVEIYNGATGETFNDTTGFFFLPRAIDQFSYPLPQQESVVRTITTGSFATTDFLDTDMPTETLIIITPTPPTITITSGAQDYTTTTTGAGGRMTVEVVEQFGYGMAYNAYLNPFNYDEDVNWGSNFAANGPAHFKTDSNKRITCGISNDINFADTSGPNAHGYLPGQPRTTNLSHIALVYHGLFLVPTSGIYHFATNSDDFGYIWAGEVAYSNWTAENAVASNGYNQPTTSIPQNFTAYDRVPVTILYANGGGDCRANFSLIMPGGESVDNFYRLFLNPSLQEAPEVPRWIPAYADGPCAAPPSP